MHTPCVEALHLVAKNNECIDQNIVLTQKINGVRTSINLTGYTFMAQARKTKLITSPLICAITVSIVGSVEDGRIRLFVADTIIRTLDPQRGYYDLLARLNGGPINNLYLAPFIIEPGITEWL